jgi:hypothetical protein
MNKEQREDGISSTDKKVIDKYMNQARPLPETQRVYGLMVKHKKLMGQAKGFLPIKEPALLLEKMDGNVKILEGMEAGIYKFKVGDDPAILILDDYKLKTMIYGTDRIKVWWAHEKYAFCFPHDSRHDSVLVERLVKKYQAIVEDYQAKKTLAWGRLLFYVLLGLAILYWLYIQGKKGELQQTVIVMENATRYVGG